MSWNWFFVLYSMASVFIIIGFLWKIAIIPLVLVTLPFNPFFQKILMFFILLIPNYFMVSYSVLVIIYANDGDRSILTLIIGGLFLTLYLLLGIGQAQREAERDFDYTNIHLIRYRYYGLIISIIYYIYSIFDISFAINSTTSWIARVISWIQGIPILNWFIAAFGFLYVIYVIIMSLLIIIGMISMAFEKKKQTDIIDI